MDGIITLLKSHRGSIIILLVFFKTKMIPEQERIIFVDNESLFKDVVEQEGYNEYFTDCFAGEFGHCTRKGNRLLADNIADVILKEVFDLELEKGKGEDE